MLVAPGAGAADPPPELAGIARETYRDIPERELDLIAAIMMPMFGGRDVAVPLKAWFAGRRAWKDGRKTEANALWQGGAEAARDVKDLPRVAFPAVPDAQLELVREFRDPKVDGVVMWIARWPVGGLTQYGVLMAPESPPPAMEEKPRYPLILYLHGGTGGVSTYALPWLASMARTGYAIIAPSLRGQPLFASSDPNGNFDDYRSEGQIENLLGEVDDALAAAAGARKLKFVDSGKFAVLGHSYGAGVGLLAAVRSPDVACTVSYDAWFTNPFRYYWDRMRRGENNWQSWEEFCSQPVEQQLAELMKRSVTHNADLISGPVLLFLGGDDAYKTTVFHKSHRDLAKQLERHKKPHELSVASSGGHFFVMYYDSPPAKHAFGKHMVFLGKHLPPLGGAPPTESVEGPVEEPAQDEPAVPPPPK